MLNLFCDLTETHLASGLSDDIVLMGIIPGLSRNLAWDQRPVLNLLSQSWANAMTSHESLTCDQLYSPDTILSSRGFIVSRFRVSRAFSPNPKSPWEEDMSLWAWNPFVGITSMLPPPPAHLLPKYVIKFVCDGERVYAIIPGFQTEEQTVEHEVYHVWTLNLREFNVIWRKLPSLPRVGRNVDVSNCVGDIYICQRDNEFSWKSDRIWKLSGSGADNNEWHWQDINPNMPPPKGLNFNTSDRAPSYIEINEVFYMDVVLKCLYERQSLPYQFLNPIPRIPQCASYIFLIPDADCEGSVESESHPVTYRELYCFGVHHAVNDGAVNGGVHLLKAELDNEKTRIVEEGDFVDFVEGWADELEDDAEGHNNPEFRRGNPRIARAIQVFPCTKWKKQYRLDLGTWKNTVDNIGMGNVAHFGAIYVYQLKGRKFVDEH